MRKKWFFPVLVMLAVAGFTSCYYDKEELLYGNVNSGPCTDTVGTVSYTQKVMPVLRQYCYSCHTGSFPSGNQLMGTYTADKAMAQSGKLYGSISHASGYSAMPKGMGKLNNCQLAVVKKWIDSGVPNN